MSGDEVLKELAEQEAAAMAAARRELRAAVERLATTGDGTATGLLASWADMTGATAEEMSFFALHAALWREFNGRFAARLRELYTIAESNYV